MRNRGNTLLALFVASAIAGCAANDSGTSRKTAQEPVAFSIVSVPAGEVMIDDRAMGRTPLKDVELAAGDHVVRIRRDGFEEWKQTITVGPDQTTGIDVTLIASDPMDPAVLAEVANALEIEPVPVEVDERFRGATRKSVVAAYPRGDLRVEDIDSFRIDVTEEFEPNGKLEFRIGTKVLHSEEFDPESFVTSRGIPDVVAEQAKPGKTVTWGYYPSKGKAVTTKFRVVKMDKRLQKRVDSLNKRMEGQPELLRDQMLAQLWLSKRLYYAAYRDARSVVERSEAAPQSLTIMQSALRRMKLKNTALWSEIEEEVSRLPSRYRLRPTTR